MARTSGDVDRPRDSGAQIPGPSLTVRVLPACRSPCRAPAAPVSPQCPPGWGSAATGTQDPLGSARSPTKMHAANVRGNHSQTPARRASFPLPAHGSAADPHAPRAQGPPSRAPCTADAPAPSHAAGPALARPQKRRSRPASSPVPSPHLTRHPRSGCLINASNK